MKLTTDDNRRRFYSGEPSASEDLSRAHIGSDVSYDRNKDHEVNGLVLVRTPEGKRAVPVSSAFSGVAYLRKLAGHRIRVGREERRLLEESDRARAETELLHPEFIKSIMSMHPGHRLAGDVRVVNCSSCGILLLGASSEWLRRMVGREGFRMLKYLPPSVGGEANGRPVCGGCAA